MFVELVNLSSNTLKDSFENPIGKIVVLPNQRKEKTSRKIIRKF